jgi:hypothetical protein
LASRNFGYDFAVIVVYPNDVGVVGDLVERLEIKVCIPACFYIVCSLFNLTLQFNLQDIMSANWAVYGYPAIPPFDGKRDYVCNSTFGML